MPVWLALLPLLATAPDLHVLDQGTVDRVACNVVVGGRCVDGATVGGSGGAGGDANVQVIIVPRGGDGGAGGNAVGGSPMGNSRPVPSFNCAYARTPDEILICQDPQLSELDRNLASVYSRVRRNSSGSGRARLDADQAAWLHSRRACGRDAGCIAAHYRTRIQVLAAY